jgi:multidrug efflux pump subunit AcrB
MATTLSLVVFCAVSFMLSTQGRVFYRFGLTAVAVLISLLVSFTLTR